MYEDNGKYDIWIVPPLVCAMLYINERKFRPRDEAKHLERIRNVCENSVELY